MTQILAFLALSITIFLMSGMPTSGSGQNSIKDSGCKSQIAFSVVEETGVAIYVMNSDGSGLQQIIESNYGASTQTGMAWSPDGLRIGFFRFIYTDTFQLFPYMAKADGTDRHQLSDSLDYNYSWFRWSPDGQWVLFVAYPLRHVEAAELHLISVDNNKLIKFMPKNVYMVGSPDWSPDGKTITLSASPDEGSPDDIYLISVDDVLKGLPVSFTNLTNDQYKNIFPTWSPKGDKIAFSSNREGDYDIYIMNPDGSDQVKLTSSDGHYLRPKWSPDNQWIAYESIGKLYIVNRDGNESKLIAENIGDYEWSPDSKKLAISVRPFPESLDADTLKIYDINTGDEAYPSANSIKNLVGFENLEWSPCIR